MEKLVDKKYHKKLEFIRTYSIHRETNEIEAKKKKIILYVKDRYKKGKDFSYKDILRDLHTDTRPCFKSIYEIYQEAGIPFPPQKLKNIRSKNYEKARNELKEKVLQYIKDEVKKGRHPSGVEVSKKFGISHVWNIFKISEIYHELGLPSYHERGHKRLIISTLSHSS